MLAGAAMKKLRPAAAGRAGERSQRVRGLPGGRIFSCSLMAEAFAAAKRGRRRCARRFSI